MLSIEQMGARDVVDLLEGLTLEHYDIPHTAAPLIFEAADAGDEVALDLVRWAGHELGKLAVGVCHQLGLENEPFETILRSLFLDKSLDGAHPADVLCQVANHCSHPGTRLPKGNARMTRE